MSLLSFSFVLPLALWGALGAADLPVLPVEAEIEAALDRAVDATLLGLGATSLLSVVAGGLLGRKQRLRRHRAALAGLGGCAAALGLLPAVALLYGTGLTISPLLPLAAVTGAQFGALLLTLGSTGRAVDDRVLQGRGGSPPPAGPEDA